MTFPLSSQHDGSPALLTADLSSCTEPLPRHVAFCCSIFPQSLVLACFLFLLMLTPSSSGTKSGSVPFYLMKGKLSPPEGKKGKVCYSEVLHARLLFCYRPPLETAFPRATDRLLTFFIASPQSRYFFLRSRGTPFPDRPRDRLSSPFTVQGCPRSERL